MITYINYDGHRQSIKIDLREIKFETFSKYFKIQYPKSIHRQEVGFGTSLELSNKYTVTFCKYVEEFISPLFFVNNTRIEYKHILLFNNEINLLLKYWIVNVDIVTQHHESIKYIGWNLDKLLSEATIKSIIE